MSAFEIDRSARGVTIVCSMSVLFVIPGSEVDELAVAELMIVPPSLGAVRLRVMGGAVPGARLARVHVIWPLEGGEHVQPVPDALAPLTPAGKVSVTVTGAAVLGPALLIESV